MGVRMDSFSEGCLFEVIGVDPCLFWGFSVVSPLFADESFFVALDWLNYDVIRVDSKLPKRA